MVKNDSKTVLSVSMNLQDPSEIVGRRVTDGQLEPEFEREFEFEFEFGTFKVEFHAVN